MSASWYVVGLLYALGARMAYLAIELGIPDDRRALWLAPLWPLFVVFGLVERAYDATIGDWLWRRRHRAWCAGTWPDKPRGEPSSAGDATTLENSNVPEP